MDKHGIAPSARPENDILRPLPTRTRGGVSKPGRQTYIYFIRAGYDGPIKIGRADNPAQRLSTLQVGHHEELHLLASYKADGAEEAVWHRRFAHLRIRGEWFRPSDDMLALIGEKSLMGPHVELRVMPDYRIDFIGRCMGIPNLSERSDWMEHVARHLAAERERDLLRAPHNPFKESHR